MVRSFVLLVAIQSAPIIAYLQRYLLVLPAQLHPNVLCRPMTVGIGERFLQGELERLALLITENLCFPLLLKQAAYASAFAKAFNYCMQLCAHVTMRRGRNSRFAQQPYDAATLGETLA